jgi:Ca-activated chloride channel family protein
VLLLAAALLAALLLSAPARAQDAVPTVGGGSFNAAPLLEPGVTYRDSLLRGEYLYYALPVQSGQRLHVRVRIPDVDAGTWERGQDAFSINLHTPQREAVGTPVAEDIAGIGNTGPTDVTDARAGDRLRWEFYGPRAEPFLATAQDENAYAGPGTWYVSLHSVRANDDERVAELPVELTLDVDGEPVAEEPDPTPSPTPTPAPAATTAPADGDGGDAPRPLALLGVGVAGVAAGLVAGRSLGRR